MALELGVFDLMPRDLPPFARGFSSALMATTLCYPLDTVRCGARHSCLCMLQHHATMSMCLEHSHVVLADMPVTQGCQGIALELFLWCSAQRSAVS